VRCRAIPFAEQNSEGEKGMRSHALTLGAAAAALLAVSACSDNGGANKSDPAQTPAAKKAAGDKTISTGLAADGKFMAVAKAAGLDQTLAGPGPYTVFAPSDAAFDAAPAGTFDTKPDNRGQLTAVLTNLILPGTVMAEDIGKAIDAGKGKAVLATMGGGTLTATKDGDKIVLTDAAGNKAAVTQADDQFTNGVVHHIDAVLMPGKNQPAAPAVGDKAG
jgi:uncharacterized surface protein with fasciclin (FAS1) repeats